MTLEVIRGGIESDSSPRAGAVIIFRSAIVLVRPLKGTVRLGSNVDDEWLLPKGHIEPGESSKEAATREATEETGMIVVPMEDTPPIEMETPISSLPIQWHVFRGVAFMSEKQKDSRHVGIFPPLAALAKLTFPDHRKVLAQVLAGSDDGF